MVNSGNRRKATYRECQSTSYQQNQHIDATAVEDTIDLWVLWTTKVPAKKLYLHTVIIESGLLTWLIRRLRMSVCIFPVRYQENNSITAEKR